jgi:hypothetical protein
MFLLSSLLWVTLWQDQVVPDVWNVNRDDVALVRALELDDPELLKKRIASGPPITNSQVLVWATTTFTSVNCVRYLLLTGENPDRIISFHGRRGTVFVHAVNTYGNRSWQMTLYSERPKDEDSEKLREILYLLIVAGAKVPPLKEMPHLKDDPELYHLIETLRHLEDTMRRKGNFQSSKGSN